MAQGANEGSQERRFRPAAALRSLTVIISFALATAAMAQAPLSFAVDSSWPERLPNNWIMGQAAGIAVDRQDNIWVIQRPGSLTDDEKAASLNPPRTRCCNPAPPVLVFDQQGRLLKSWGGPGAGYDWPKNEHGLHIDHKGFVWLSGNGDTDGQILKFTQDGKFLMQIGKSGPQTDSKDTSRLGRPAGMVVDPETNELYVADGYYNHRVIVFDADTVIDRSTYEQPDLPSAGISQVLVAGTFVVRDGVAQRGTNPGQPVRAPVRDQK